MIYAGGGVIASDACREIRDFVAKTQIPVTTTLMGLGIMPETDPLCLQMLGMHGSVYANYAVDNADLLIGLGVRFDDRVTGRLNAFSPGSKKIHVDIDKSSINKSVRVDKPVVGDVGHVVEEMVRIWKARQVKHDQKALAAWWDQINKWRSRECLKYKPSDTIIKPQFALERLYAAIKDKDLYISTEVGQHQMWAAQFLKFEKPNRWMTSGGLGTMGYGLPAAVGQRRTWFDSVRASS